MKKLFYFIILFSMSASALHAEDNDSIQNILLLNSYHRGFKWTEDITSAAIQTLRESGFHKYQLHVEYMDTKRHSSPDYYAALKALYSRKYRNKPISAILCSDNNAYNFLKQYRRELFGKVPTFFCGFNYSDTTELNLPLSKGLLEDVDYSRGLQLAMKLHPDARHIYVVYDNSVTGRQVGKNVNKALRSMKLSANIHHLSKLSMTSILDSLKHAPKNSIVYFTIFFKDIQGNFYDYDQSVKILADNTDLPIYGSWDFSLGNGIIGGVLTSGHYQGKIMTEKAVQYLKGTPINKIATSYDSPNKFMFDYQKLKAYNIPKEALPKESIIINQPKNVLETYKSEIIAGLLSILVLTGIIFTLVINIIRRKKAEKERIEEHRRLDELVTERTNFLKSRIDELTKALLQKDRLHQETEDLKKNLMLKNQALEEQKKQNEELRQQLNKPQNSGGNA